MDILWLNLIVVSVSSLFAGLLAKKSGAERSSLESPVKPNRFFVFLLLASLILVSGLRITGGPHVIGDTAVYAASFVKKEITTQVKLIAEPTFAFLVVFIRNFITEDPQIFLLICALITNTLIILTLYRYAHPFFIGVYLYITWGAYLVTMNGVRQFLAAAIIFVATKWLLEGKWKLFLGVVLFASTIHTSALFYIPAYFIAKQQAWNRKIFLLIMLLIGGFLLFGSLIPYLFGMLMWSKYWSYQESFENASLGANAVRAIIAAIPVIIAFFSRKKLSAEYEESNILVNFSLINFFFMLFATYNWIFARMSIYFNLYNLILLPLIIRVNFTDRWLRNIVYYLLILLFLFYYYYETIVTLDIKYVSKFLSLQ